jgi:hypothetical protein
MRLAVFLLTASALCGQDAREIVRKSFDLDEANSMAMRNYTWTAKEIERHFDPKGAVTSEESKRWETVMLYGEPFRRVLERHGKPLSAEEQRREQEKLDKRVAKFAHQTPDERAHRLAKRENERKKEREFLMEIPDMFDFKIVRSDKVDGRDVWVIAATPRPNYTPRHSDAKPLLKMKGEIWIDKIESQWVRLEAETIDTISLGWFLARLSPGAKLSIEQSRVNDEIWLPKHMLVRGAARLALFKRMSMEQDLTWSNFRKFQVESTVITQ